MNRGGNDNFEIIGKTDGEDIHHGITSKARIIIAEECEKTGCALADSLKKRGFFAATRAADGVALLDVIKNERPDVVIVGLFMKETDAPELIRRSSCLERRPFFIVLQQKQKIRRSHGSRVENNDPAAPEMEQISISES